MGVKSDAHSVIDGAVAWSQFQLGSSDFDDDLLPSPLDVLPVGICAGDARSILYGNRAASALLGRRVKSGLALSQLTQRHAIYRAGTDALYPTERLPLARAAHGEACSADDLELRRGSERIRLRMQAEPLLDRSGRVLFALATLQESEPSADGASLDVTGPRWIDLAGPFERLIEVCRRGEPPSQQLLSDCERELAQRPSDTG